VLIPDPPEIEVERSWVHSGEGYEAQLVCIVHGEPAPDMSWYQDTFLIEPSVSDRRPFGDAWQQTHTHHQKRSKHGLWQLQLRRGQQLGARQKKTWNFLVSFFFFFFLKKKKKRERIRVPPAT
ncbi:hypothetical protein WDU94_008573, partial [Cyamophila willieti]